MSLLDLLHGRLVHVPRVFILRDHLAPLIPEGARVLDVGCGDGLLSCAIARIRPDIEMRGVDVGVRSGTAIPVDPFDGHHLPCADRSMDAVMLVDVLHHTDDPAELLGEAARVARACILVKDHLREGVLAVPRLRFMDWVGNARHRVSLPYNYWTRDAWDRAFERLGLSVGAWRGCLGLYPRPFHLIFEQRLHFIARLDVGPRARPERSRGADGA